MTGVEHAGPVWVGLDVHKDVIAVAVLGEREGSPVVELTGADPDAVRRLVHRLGRPRQLRVCYEAGPAGYELYRQLARMGVSCQVIAPSLIPKAPGDRVKTDRRDAARLVRLFRAGELVAVRVPTPVEEAVRDLCRARGDVVADRGRARHRLEKFLLRHGQVYRGKTGWTLAHRRWLAALSFDEPALTATLRHYRAVVDERDATLRAIEAELLPWATREPFAAQIRRLICYRGVAELAGLTFATEVCDWRRFTSAPAFMAFTGLTPSEHSSGGSRWQGHVTKTGNEHLRTQLVESAWAYRYPPRIATALARRQAGAGPGTLGRSWRAQQRLCGRFHRLAETKPARPVAATAVARELGGFLWAEMTATD